VATNVGGTSAVAPLWSALIARINQKLGKPAGYLTPLLYTSIGKSSAFHDITVGNNDPTGNIGGYNAGPGWDACTGWGSPDGASLLNALSSGAAGSGATGSGSSGGTSGSGNPSQGGVAVPSLPVPNAGGQSGSAPLSLTSIIMIVLIVLAVLAALLANRVF